MKKDIKEETGKSYDALLKEIEYLKKDYEVLRKIMDEKFLRTEDACSYLGFTERRLKFFVDRGQIPCFTTDGIDFFHLHDLDEFLEKLCEDKSTKSTNLK